MHLDENRTYFCVNTSVDFSNYTSIPSIEKLEEHMEEILGPPVIKVWRGEIPCWKKALYGEWIIENQKYSHLPECPRFIEDDNLLPSQDDNMYIMAGVGIIASKRVQDLLWKEGVLLVWVDTAEEATDFKS